jgi:hypothetical protein
MVATKGKKLKASPVAQTSPNPVTVHCVTSHDIATGSTFSSPCGVGIDVGVHELSWSVNTPPEGDGPWPQESLQYGLTMTSHAVVGQATTVAYAPPGTMSDVPQPSACCETADGPDRRSPAATHVVGLGHVSCVASRLPHPNGIVRRQPVAPIQST